MEERPLQGGSAFRARLELQLGTAQRESGHLGAALEALSRAFRLAEEAGTTDLVIEVGREFGLTLLAASRLAEADALLRRVLGMTAERYGEDSAEWAAAAQELALARRARGDLEGALRLQQQALETARRALGELSPTAWEMGMNLAAATYINRLLVPLSGAMLRRGPRMPLPGRDFRFSGSYSTPARVRLIDSGQFEASLETLRTAWSTDPDLAAAPLRAWVDSALVRTLATSQDPVHVNAGFDIARRVLDERNTALGELHPQTLNSMQLLSRAAAPRDIGYAIEIGSEAAQASEKVLGRGHLDTLGAYENLSALLELHGDTVAAGDLRQENILLRAADEGILGEEQPPIENLAGSLTEPLTLITEGVAAADWRPPDGVVVDTGPEAVVLSEEAPLIGGGEAVDDVEDRLVRRTAHVELDPAREIEPEERFEVGVHVDCAPAQGEGSAELRLRPAPGVTELDLRVWLVVSRHFEIEGDAIKALHLDLGKEASTRLAFAVLAAHVDEYSDDEPEVRVLFSYLDWPSGEVRLPVPLARAATEPVR